MRRWESLNERQVRVLRRIGEGDNLSGPDGLSDRRSATALADRGLVKVSKRDGWKAAVTEDGQFYLEHGHHPAHPDFQGTAAEGGASRSTGRAATSPDGGHGGSGRQRRPPPRATAAIAAKRRTAATELVGTLVETGDVVYRGLSDEENAELRKVIDFAKRHHLVPAGKRIEKSRRWDGLHLLLIDGAHINAKPSNVPAVSVPTEVTVLHPLLATLSNPAQVLGVSEASSARALRIMHALLQEAERRGYEVGWSTDPEQGVEIRIDGDTQTVTMAEERSTEHVLPSVEELGTKYSWQRVRPQLRDVATGKLAMAVTGQGAFRTQRRWADRKRWSLEDRLGDVLATVETQAKEKRDERRAAKEAREQRQQEWAAAMEKATARFHHDRRVAALTKQMDQWERARTVRDFLAAAEASGVADADWLGWIGGYADSIDPTTTAIVAPPKVEPRPQDLQPYLGRRNPYGPDSR